MNAAERRAVAVLAFVMMARLLGLFLLLPVLALHADTLRGATPALGGLAVGAYGITQALFQFPFGLLSDRYGRKPLIVTGLAIFACGSLIAAHATSIAILIAGRALQGAGAISGAVMALVADLTRADVRTRAMAVIGVSIGASFMLSLLLGPLLGSVIGVRGLFLCGVALALVATALVVFAVPSAALPVTAASRRLREALAVPGLLVLDCGVFLLHALLTAIFVAVPYLLRDALGLPEERHWLFYLAALTFSLAGTIPMIVAVERGGASVPAWRLSPLLLGGGAALLAAATQLGQALAGMLLFFAGFNFLEARLPAEISRRADEGRRGVALSVFGIAQFMGAFAGSAFGGVLRGQIGARSVFAACTCLALLGAGGAVVATRRVPG
jgi:MFS family permease